MEWSPTMRRYYAAIGDHSRAEELAGYIRNEAAGDFRPADADLVPWSNSRIRVAVSATADAIGAMIRHKGRDRHAGTATG
jgi:hypothetical protein